MFTPRKYTPHAWEWSDDRVPGRRFAHAFPTHTGMVPKAKSCSRSSSVFPVHTGMDRCTITELVCSKAYAPHTRGWTAGRKASKTRIRVCPAPAGMVRPFHLQWSNSNVVPADAGMNQ